MKKKLIPGKVSIQQCNIGWGFSYKGECFSYVWGHRPFGREWWLNLLLHSGIKVQDAEKWVEVAKKKRAKSVRNAGTLETGPKTQPPSKGADEDGRRN